MIFIFLVGEMTLEEEKLNQNEWVRGLLKEEHKAELWKILAFWEKYKEEWEKMKKEFWNVGFRRIVFVRLLKQYRESKKVYMENLSEEEGKILDRLNEVWKEKFIEIYLHDKILYSWDKNKEVERKEEYKYYEWEAWEAVIEEWVTLNFFNSNIWSGRVEEISKIKLKEWVMLNLSFNDVWDVWAEEISKMELKKWVVLDLEYNNIWAAWAEAISKMKLKEWVILDLKGNSIWDEWVEAISKMELKEWVTLNLNGNHIWDEWVEAIMKNMDLKEWVTLDLGSNRISEKVKKKLGEWVRWYWDKWINCGVIVSLYY